MLKLTTKTRYGTRALLEIGSNYNLRPTKKKEIVASTGISSSYLENILVSLRNSGVIDATRGANGGFVLRRAPELVTMLEGVEALQGSAVAEASADLPACVTEDLWREVKAAQDAVLRSKSLRDLIDLQKGGDSLGYAI